MFDYFVFTVNTVHGEDRGDPGGELICAAPPHAARNRMKDLLFGMLTFSGNASIPIAHQQEFTEKIQRYFFSTQGTVTSALRSAAEQLNDFLLNRNLNQSYEGVQAVGLLSLAAIHNDQVYIAHAGITHTMLLRGKQWSDYSDPLTGIKGLGLSRSANIKYYQTTIEPGDTIIFCQNPSPSWNEELIQQDGKVTMEQLRRTISGHSSADTQAMVLRIQRGSEKIQRLRSRQEKVSESGKIRDRDHEQVKPMSPRETWKDSAPSPAANSQRNPRPEKGNLPRNATLSSFEQILEQNKSQINALRHKLKQAKPKADGSPDRKPENKTSSSFKEQADGLKKKTLGLYSSLAGSIRQTSAHLWSKSSTTREGAKNFFALPTLSVSPSVKLIIAILVPLVVVGVTTSIYIKNGVAQRQTAYITQAQQSISQAEIERDQGLQWDAWNQALILIKKAEEDGKTEELDKLHERVLLQLDKINDINRPILTSMLSTALAETANIVRMAGEGSDLYMLDSSVNKIFRVITSAGNYQIDDKFTCESDTVEGIDVGVFVDMLTVPAQNSYKASVIAADKDGNLLYCGNNVTPHAVTLLPGDGVDQADIQNIRLDGIHFYTFDKKSNMIWRYTGADLTFDEPPTKVFDNQIPNLADVVDMAINQDDLFLLHENGDVSQCAYSPYDFSNTHCVDTSLFAANRPNQTEVVSKQARFIQMMSTKPPDPSMYILDNEGMAVYHYSLKVNFQKKMVPQMEEGFPKPQKKASAFAILQNRIVVLAFGNELLMTMLP